MKAPVEFATMLTPRILLKLVILSVLTMAEVDGMLSELPKAVKKRANKDRPRRLDEGEEHHGGPGEEVAQNHAALGADFVDEDAGKGAQQAGHDARHGENHAKLPACRARCPA